VGRADERPCDEPEQLSGSGAVRKDGGEVMPIGALSFGGNVCGRRREREHSAWSDARRDGVVCRLAPSSCLALILNCDVERVTSVPKVCVCAPRYWT